MPLEDFRLEPVEGADLCWLSYRRNGDSRGWLAEVFNQSGVSELGLPVFGQDNFSRTPLRGSIRGLHFQHPPHAQSKLFRVVTGSVTNVVIDLRPAHFGRVHAVTMTADDDRWIWIPRGHAHGFQTLEDNVIVHYKPAEPFVPSALGTVSCRDRRFQGVWSLTCDDSMLSERDRGAAPVEVARDVFAGWSGGPGGQSCAF